MTCLTNRFVLRSTALTIALELTAAGLPAAQGPPVQGTIALEGTMKKFYRAANVVVVATIDGVEHVYHFAKNLVVHGGKSPGSDALEELQEGTTVVIHYDIQRTEQAAARSTLSETKGSKRRKAWSRGSIGAAGRLPSATTTAAPRCSSRTSVAIANGRTIN